MGFPPEICLIGAQKSGTTSLAYVLDQHPNISVAKNKEPLFYTHNWRKGLSWYRRQFPEEENNVFLDASPSFTEAPLRLPDEHSIYSGVPEKVKAISPGSKFIYLLRDPIERTYSGYWAEVRHGNEKREFREAMFDPKARYLDTSDYYGQLELWLRYFRLESFLFLLLDEFKQDPIDTARRCFRFIGVDDTVQVEAETVQNRSYNVGRAGRAINKLMLRYPALIKLKYLAPQSTRDFIKRIKRGSGPIPEMKVEDRQILEDYFRPKNAQLASLTGLSLADWQSPNK